MQARCPHCTRVFETQASGIQTCPNCGQQINVPGVAAPVPTPVQGGKPEAVPQSREPTPWERRGELGLVQAVWQTWKLTMITPEVFWVRLRPEASWSDAFLYAWLITGVAGLLQIPLNILNFSSLQSQLAAMSSSAGNQSPEVANIVEKLGEVMGEHSIAVAVGLALAGVILFPLSFLINGAIIHLGCLIFGAGKNGFGATLRVVGYSLAPMALSWVPVVGGLLGIYVIVLEVWGISKVQETSTGRAAGGVLAVPVLLFCCVCGLGIAAVAAVAGRN